MVKHLSILAGLLLSILILSSFSVYDPTCENESLPLGIDTPHPTFSWKIHSESRSFQQYAYQIVVGTESDFSESHCLWNSGKILSDESILRPYSGPALKSFSIYYWRVRVWDTHGNASPWSCTRKFVMGVLTPADWGKALWIGLEKDNPQSYLVPGLHGLDEVKKKLGSRKTETYKLPYLRRDIAITKRIKSAYAYVSGLGQFDFFINGEKRFVHTPWRCDCATFRDQSPVSGNFWNGLSSSDYSRSGWCPGTATNPVWFDLGDLKPGKHTLSVAIPQGKDEGESFSHWMVSGVVTYEK